MNLKEKVIVIGAGPSGLTCALQLAKAGYNVSIIEKTSSVGGLMRNINFNDYSVDLGRKELYTRLKAVNNFWSELLKDDYKVYDYHVGFLYKGRVLEKTASYKGPLRGMSIGLFLRCVIDFIKWKLKTTKPKNYQEFVYKNRGELLNRIFSQDFFEKFDGRKWVDLPLPDKESKESKRLTTKDSLKKFATNIGDEKTGQDSWRHPNKGAGQITDLINQELIHHNVDFYFNTEITGVEVFENIIERIRIKKDDEDSELIPDIVVSSLPPEIAGKLFLNRDVSNETDSTSLNRGAIVVYLFIDENSRFPHTWLNVSDPDLKIGRIVNYSNFGGEMVPKGKTCLCIEFFLFSDDELFNNTNDEILKIAIKEANSVSLFDPSKIEKHMVFKLPNANAAVSWKDYVNEPYKVKLYEDLRAIENLYNVNRAGTDRATHAGLEAAEAIKSGNKDEFEKNTDPRLKEPWN